MGQTKRKLVTRLTEHMKDINKITSNHSVVTNHRIEMKHDFEWDKPQILDKETYYYRRLISEMIHIKSQKNALNLQSDTELLQHAYIEILNRI